MRLNNFIEARRREKESKREERLNGFVEVRRSEKKNWIGSIKHEKNTLVISL